jgi:hypothetical protein
LCTRWIYRIYLTNSSKIAHLLGLQEVSGRLGLRCHYRAHLNRSQISISYQLPIQAKVKKEIKFMVENQSTYRNSSLHRVYRVPGFLPSRPNWSPPPSHASECCSPPLWVQEGRHTGTRLRGRGGGPNSDERFDALVLVYTIIALRLTLSMAQISNTDLKGLCHDMNTYFFKV